MDVLTVGSGLEGLVIFFDQPAAPADRRDPAALRPLGARPPVE